MKKKDKLLEKLKDQYRLIIYNDTTFQSVWSTKLSRLKVFTITSLMSALIVVLVILLIATTGLREYIPGYPKAEYRQMLIRNALKVDSLEQELARRDRFFRNIQKIMEGEVPDAQLPDHAADHPIKIDIKKYNHDSIFHDKLVEEQISLRLQDEKNDFPSISQIYFFPPVKGGMVSNHFDISTGHYGIDIVGAPNAQISSVLDGTVIFAGWTINTGYVIYVQHESNLISAYKHNAELLKQTGDKVSAGEAIAIIGNTGELSTGPHLHFELWHNGTALNPEHFIEF